MRLGSIYRNVSEYDRTMTELLPAIILLGRTPCSKSYERHYALFAAAVATFWAVIRDLPELNDDHPFVEVVQRAREKLATLKLHNGTHTGDMPFELQQNYSVQMVVLCHELVTKAEKHDVRKPLMTARS